MSFENQVNFAHKLFLLLDKNSSSNSIIFSPASILNGLAIMHIFAGGETAKQIKNIINDDDDNKRSDNDLIEYYSVSVNRNNKDYGIFQNYLKVIFANQFFINKNYENLLNQKCCQLIADKFGPVFQQIDFQKPSIAALKINHFVYKSSAGRIKEIIKKESINPQTSIILVNELTFACPWKDEFFAPPNVIRTFYSTPPREIEMLRITVVRDCKWTYIENVEWQSLGIPFIDYKAWLYIVLPKDVENGLSKLIEELNFKSFKEWTKRSVNPSMFVRIPQLNETFNFPLKEILQKLGIKNTFTDSADFTKLFQGHHPAAKINHILHKTSFKIDSQGCDGYTPTQLYESQPPVRTNFFADHPFIYFVVTSKVTLKYAESTPLELLFIGTFC